MWIDEPDVGRAYFDSGAVALERLVAVRPEDPHLRADLGAAYAGFGRSSQATQEAERAVALLPLSKDMYDSSFFILALAETYVTVGEYERAIEQLETLLTIPFLLSVPMLRVDPMWDPLRDHPSFQKLLAEHGH